MKTKPSPDDMRLAAEWLDAYEGENDHANKSLSTVRRVQEWLSEQAEAIEFRSACKQASVPVALARKAIRRHGTWRNAQVGV